MSEEELKLLIYHCQNGSNVELKCFDKDTLWATQKQIALLFDCSIDNVALHIKNIYSTNELNNNSTSVFFSVVQKEGNRQVERQILHYKP